MAINTPKILDGIKVIIPNITSNRAISSILDTIANEDEQFLPSTPPGYKTRYPEFKFTNTRWKGFRETKKDLPFKKTVQYLIKAHPNIAQSVCPYSTKQ